MVLWFSMKVCRASAPKAEKRFLREPFSSSGEKRARTRSGDPRRGFVKTRGMRGLFACRVFAFGHETYLGIQSRETHNRAKFRVERGVSPRSETAHRAIRLSLRFSRNHVARFLSHGRSFFSDGSGVTNSTTRKCFWRMFWRAGSPRRASFYPTHAHARRRYVHARERSAYESLLSPTRVRRTSR